MCSSLESKFFLLVMTVDLKVGTVIVELLCNGYLQTELSKINNKLGQENMVIVEKLVVVMER